MTRSTPGLTPTPDPRNANRGTDRGRREVRRSLAELGAGRSIVLDKHGVSIAGNKTLDAARELGIPIQTIETSGETLYAIVRTDLDLAEDAKAKELAIADNRISEIGLDWDIDILDELQQEGVDFGDLFTDDEWRDLMASLETPGTDGLTDEDAVPDVPEDPVAQPGDIWRLGIHRLMCGDGTNPDDVRRLMDGHRADMLFTDPPYGVAYVGKTRRALTIENDNLGDEGTRQLVADALSIAPLRPGGAFYVCSPAGATETAFRLAIADAGLTLRQCLVWVKQQFVMGRQDYHWRHESILYGWADGASHYFVDDRTQDTVWEIDRPHRNADHPTMKPVELIAKAIRNSSCPGDRVVDLFGGSGSTLIGCEQSGRAAYVMEVDPGYVDVIIQRWQDFTGRTAEREG